MRSLLLALFTSSLLPLAGRAAADPSPAADGRLTYRTGFAWSGDGEITTAAAWLSHLQSSSTQ